MTTSIPRLTRREWRGLFGNWLSSVRIGVSAQAETLKATASSAEQSLGDDNSFQNLPHCADLLYICAAGEGQTEIPVEGCSCVGSLKLCLSW
jgi:hypothetical protein